MFPANSIRTTAVLALGLAAAFGWTATPASGKPPHGQSATVQFSSGAYSANEATTTVPISVTRTSVTGSVSVILSTTNSGTAVAGVDYTPIAGTTVKFASGAATQLVSIAIFDDGIAGEVNKTVGLSLRNPKGAALGSPSTATLTIIEAQHASITAAVDPDTISADGTSTAAVTAIVTDAAAKPLVREEVTFSTSGDVSIGSVVNQHDGTYTATVTASTTPGDETITAHDGVVTATTILHESPASAPIGWAGLVWPASASVRAGESVSVYGQVYVSGGTEATGAMAGMSGQAGYGPTGTDPASAPGWVWAAATYNSDVGNNDEYVATVAPNAVGTFDYVYRFSTDGGTSWFYADLAGPIGSGTGGVAPDPGVLTVSAPNLVISEFRTRGPAGTADEFVELYNGSDSALSVGGWQVRASGATGLTSTLATLTAGTTIPAGCHYLLANNSGYSASVSADQTYSTGIADSGGVALTLPDATPLDQVGMSSGSAYKEGNPLTPLTTNTDQSYARINGYQDTNDNSTDFTPTTPSTPNNAATCGTQGLTLTVTVAPGTQFDPPSTWGVVQNYVFVGDELHAAYEPVQVTAIDGAGATRTGFTGTVSLASSNCPLLVEGGASYTYTPSDLGTHVFSIAFGDTSAFGTPGPSGSLAARSCTVTAHEGTAAYADGTQSVSVNPGEYCDGIDNNQNQLVDELYPQKGTSVTILRSGQLVTGTWVCGADLTSIVPSV